MAPAHHHEAPTGEPSPVTETTEASERAGGILAVALPIFAPNVRPVVAAVVGLLVLGSALVSTALWLDSRAQAYVSEAASRVVSAKAQELSDRVQTAADGLETLKSRVDEHEARFEKLGEKLDHISTTVDTTAGEVQTLLNQRRR